MTAFPSFHRRIGFVLTAIVSPAMLVPACVRSQARPQLQATAPAPATQVESGEASAASSQPDAASPATSKAAAQTQPGPAPATLAGPAPTRTVQPSAPLLNTAELPPLGPATLWIPAEGELCIDLDTSRTASPPEDVAGDSGQRSAWIEQQGLDLEWIAGQHPAIAFHNASLGFVNPEQWDTITPEMVAEAFSSGSAANQSQQGIIVSSLRNETDQPAALITLIRTREGGLGILRIRQASKRTSKPGFEVEYRMLAQLDTAVVADLSPEQLGERVEQLRKDQQDASTALLRAKAMFDPQDPRIAKAESLLKNITYQVNTLETVRKAKIAATQPAATEPLASGSAPAVNLRFEDFPSRFADGNCLQGLPRPVVLTGEKKPAFCKSDRPLLFDMHHSPIPSKMLLDESAGTGAGYDTLYLDYNDNGDFLDDPVYRPTTCLDTMFPGSEPVVLYFRNVHIPRNLKQGRSCYVQIFIERLPGWPEDITSLHPRIIPQRWAVGTVRFGEWEIPAAVIDRNWDDTFVTKAGVDPNRVPSDIPRGDYLVLGLDGEKTLRPCDLDEYAGSARIVMNEYLAINDMAYQVKATKQPGGVSLKLVPANLPRMTRPLPGAGKAGWLALYGTKVSAVVLHPGREITVPIDDYYAPQMKGAILRGQ